MQRDKLSNMTLSQIQHRVMQLSGEQREWPPQTQKLTPKALAEYSVSLSDEDCDDLAMTPTIQMTDGRDDSPSHWAPSMSPMSPSRRREDRGHGKFVAQRGDDTQSPWAPSRSPLRRRDDRGHGKFAAQRGTGEELPRQHWDVHAETSGFDLARGLERKSSIDWKRHYEMSGKLPPLRNLLISNLILGEGCNIDELALWCQDASEHIVVVSVLPSAMKAGHFLQTFVNKATIASLHESMLQHSGATDAIAILNKANASCGNSMNTAVAAATADKFIFSIWDGGFIIAHRFLVDSISWVEWEAGPCASRFGSLRFSFHPDRMQQPDCRIGIVKNPNETSTAFPDDDVWRQIATWISADAPMLVTGNFGHGNDEGIAQTAVAAGASVDHRIRVSFNVEGMDGVAQSPGGFVIFAPCKKSIEEVSVFSEIEEAHKMGHDLIDAMEFNNPTWRTASGNDARGYIGNVRLKKVSWKHLFAGMINCRLYIGSPLPGKKKRSAVAAAHRLTSRSGVAAEREPVRLTRREPVRLTSRMPQQPSRPPPPHLLQGEPSSDKDLDSSEGKGKGKHVKEEPGPREDEQEEMPGQVIARVFFQRS